MEFTRDGNNYVVRLDLGEEVRETLTKLCADEGITSGFLYGLGAMSYAEIAYYSLADKQYHPQKFTGEFEVLNLTGNVSMVDEHPFLHMHITLGDTDYKAFGGHLVEGTVGPTLEVYVTKTPLMGRKLNETVGLKLLHFS